ncbi:hypothetical protein [Streptomyces axinellae]|uniref:Uncharacterized protein n=1 Tax=Streptomyces axinellae TaxID=552788 RepID=A0ABP6D082_9ACTN
MPSDDMRRNLLKTNSLNARYAEEPPSAWRAEGYKEWARDEEKVAIKAYNLSDDGEHEFDRMEDAGDLKRKWNQAHDAILAYNASAVAPAASREDLRDRAMSVYQEALLKQAPYSEKYDSRPDEKYFRQAKENLFQRNQQAGQPSVGEAARNLTPNPSGQQPSALRPSANTPVGQRPWETQGPKKGPGHGPSMS